MYADKITDSMRRAIDETKRRREIQMAYNEEHGIEPQTVRKAINDIMGYITDDVAGTTAEQVNKELAELSREEVLRIISSMEDEMAAASASMDFEEAARLRDQVVKLRSSFEGQSEEDVLKDLKRTARKGSAFAASASMDFEEAARLRDQVVKLRSSFEGQSEEDVLKDLKRTARKGSAFGNRKNAAYGSSRRS